MKAKKITDSEIEGFKISSLPTRPCAPVPYGGKGYTSSQIKEAFDKMPLYIIQKYNELIGDIYGEGGDSIADAIPTGIEEGQTLGDMFEDIKSGSFAAYLSLGESTLAEEFLALKTAVASLMASTASAAQELSETEPEVK